MIPHSIAHGCSSLLANLAAPAMRSLVLACSAALALAAFRVKNVATRLAVWTAVLYAALAMPLLGMMLPSVSFKIPAAAMNLISIRVGSSVAPLAGENPVRVKVMPRAAVIISPDAYPSKHNALAVPPRGVVHDREFVVSHAAPIPTDSDSAADSESFSYSRPAIVPRSPAAPANSKLPWTAIAAGIYAVVTLLILARLALGFFVSRRLVRSAHRIVDWEAACPLDNQAREAGLLVTPELKESSSISVPVTMGVLRPAILFPIEWREWDAAALHAVIAHELSHVSRRDALTQRLSLIHRAVFWFSPLSWWLHRRLADVAEEASDEAALVSGADRAHYAETLLGFFAALQEAPRRVNWQGVSMAKAGQAEKRVDRILAWKGDVGMRTNKFVGIALILAGVPAVLFAAAARPSVGDTSVVEVRASQNQVERQTVNPAPNPAPAPPSPAPKALATPQAPAAPKAPAPSPAPAPPMAPSAHAAAPIPMPPLPPIPPAADSQSGVLVIPGVHVQLNNYISDEEIQKIRKQLNEALSNVDKDKIYAEVQKSIAEAQKNLDFQFKEFQKDGKFQMQFAGPVKVRTGDGGFSDRYVVVSGDSPIFMSGDSQDVEHATSLRGKISGDFIWFQRDEKSYVIHDQATVNRAKEIFKPQQELGEKQQALGKQQQALGDQQRDIGKKMQSAQVQLPDMSADMQKLEAEMKQLSAGATQQQVGDLQRQIGELQRKIGQVQSQAGDQMRKDSEPMRALGEQQRQLGEQQRALGQQQRDAGRQARDQMKQLLDDAVTKGTAQPE